MKATLEKILLNEISKAGHENLRNPKGFMITLRLQDPKTVKQENSQGVKNTLPDINVPFSLN